jgi:chemotaxis protein MotA
MPYIIGLILATIGFLSALNHLRQPMGVYYDVVAVIMVIGGTTAVGIMTLPWQSLRDVLYCFQLFLGLKRTDEKRLVSSSLQFITSPPSPTNAVTGPAGTVLRDGDELISLGFTPEKIQEILETRIGESFDRLHKINNALRGLAKYPPAFGLMGTVLGLVSLMRAVSAGLEARQTGVQMAVALTATLYGLVVANLLVSPAGEILLKTILDEKRMAEIALRAVLLKVNRANPLEAQEVLNSFVAENNRVSVIQVDNAGKVAA